MSAEYGPRDAGFNGGPCGMTFYRKMVIVFRIDGGQARLNRTDVLPCGVAPVARRAIIDSVRLTDVLLLRAGSTSVTGRVPAGGAHPSAEVMRSERGQTAVAGL